MLPLDSSTRPGEPSTCHRSSVNCTGFGSHIGSNSVSPYSPTGCLNGTAPQYLADGLQRVADISSRSRLRSASTALLHVPRSNQKTIGDRAFPVAAATVWNSLPPWITSLPSFLRFRKALRTELLRIGIVNCSYGDDHTATPATGH